MCSVNVEYQVQSHVISLRFKVFLNVFNRYVCLVTQLQKHSASLCVCVCRYHVAWTTPSFSVVMDMYGAVDGRLMDKQV